jgi:hypothetical protein
MFFRSLERCFNQVKIISKKNKKFKDLLFFFLIIVNIENYKIRKKNFK